MRYPLAAVRTSVTMGLVEDFEKAAEEATTLLPATLSQEIQLILYSLFKQSKFGDNDTRKGSFSTAMDNTIFLPASSQARFLRL